MQFSIELRRHIIWRPTVLMSKQLFLLSTFNEIYPRETYKRSYADYKVIALINDRSYIPASIGRIRKFRRLSRRWERRGQGLRVR